MQQTSAVPEFKTVELGQMVASRTNPRKHFDLTDLEASVRQQGRVLVPVLLRRVAGEGVFEILDGERRFRVASKVGIAELPAQIIECTDAEALEIQVVANLQRSDLHPLEEAQGYQQLVKAKYDVARIAERTGRTTAYIYDRLKLLNLTSAAQRLFSEKRFELGHAVILARQAPEVQDRIIGEHDGAYGYEGPLWQEEQLLFDPEEDGEGDGGFSQKPISARELQAWVDKHVRFNAAAPDQMLFPDTALALREAADQGDKVVHITHERQLVPEAKQDGKRTYGPQSWKRADGTRESKTCPSAVLGLVVAGAGNGQAFAVCIDKKGCSVHWASEQREAKQRARASSAAGDTGEERAAAARRQREEDEARRKAEAERWKKAEPELVKALAAAAKKAPSGATSPLGKLVLDALRDQLYLAGDAEKVLPAGKTAEDLVRHMGFALILSDLRDGYSQDLVVKNAKAVGVDVLKIVNVGEEARPAAKKPAAKKAPAKKAGKR